MAESEHITNGGNHPAEKVISLHPTE